MKFATGLLLLVAAYAALGILFAIAFVIRGVERVDPSTHRASWGFRILILPGCAALWPWMAAKWAGKRGRQ